MGSAHTYINNLGCLDALIVCLHRAAVGRHLAKLLGFVISNLYYTMRSESTRGRLVDTGLSRSKRVRRQ